MVNADSTSPVKRAPLRWCGGGNIPGGFVFFSPIPGPAKLSSARARLK